MSKNFRFLLIPILSTIFFVIITYRLNAKDQYLNKKILKNNFTIEGEAKIIDGDSIIIKAHEIRLLDIDAPEYFQNCQDKNNKEYKCGQDSFRYLKNLSHNKKLKCHITGKDYYDRHLGTCFIGKENINEKLIESGMAITYSHESKYYPKMKIAQKNKAGIWQGKFLTPKIYRKLNKKTN